MMNTEEQFLDWLSVSVTPSRLTDYYLAMENVKTFANQKGIIRGSLYDVTDSSISDQIVQALSSDRIYKFTHRSQWKDTLEAAKMFHKYTEKKGQHATAFKPTSQEPTRFESASQESTRFESASQEPARFEPTRFVPTPQESVDGAQSNDALRVQEKVAEEESVGNLKVDFTEDADYTATKPVSISYFGDRKLVFSWVNVYRKVCTLLYDDYPMKFKELAREDVPKQFGRIVYGKECVGQLLKPKEIANGYYIELCKGANGIVVSIKSLLEYCAVDYENLEIMYQSRHAQSANTGMSLHTSMDKNMGTSMSQSTSLVAEGADPDWRNEFGQWLERTNGKAIADALLSEMLLIDKYAQRNRFTQKSFFEMEDYQTVKSVRNQLELDPEFGRYNQQHSNRPHDVLRKYDLFRLNHAKNPKNHDATATASAQRANVSGTQGSGYAYASEMQGSNLPNAPEMQGSNLPNASETRRSNELRMTERQSDGHTNVLEMQGSDSPYTPVAHGNDHPYTLETQRSDDPHTSVVHGNNRLYTPEEPEARRGGHPCQREFERWLEECDTPARSIKTYSTAIKHLGDYLLRSGKEERHLFSIFGISRLEGIYKMLENDSDYASKYGKENIFFDMYALRKYIAYRRNDRSGDLDPVTIERYSAVLREHFPDGFCQEQMIHRNKFRHFYEEAYEEELGEGDTGMVEKIRQIGALRDGRIYARSGDSQNDLLDDIQADIAKTFQEGARRIYLSCVFEKYQAELAEKLQIYSEDVMREVLLNTSYGAYQCKELYFYIKGRKTDFDSNVQGILKESPVPIPMSQLGERLWYLPEEQIKHALPKAKGFVNIGGETYFYAPNAPISKEELGQVSALLRGKLSQRICITEEELRDMLKAECPSVAINMEEFSTRGLKNVLVYLLDDQITARGSLIYEKGRDVSSDQALVAFCESHERLQLEELDEFAKDMNMTLASKWDKLYDMMVRVSSDEFVRRGRLQFDIKRTDEALDRLIEGDYMPIKQFTLYMHLPAISEQWNEFVLESYLLQYSREFTILQAGHYRDECCGAIARRSSHFNDIASVMTDALARNSGWKTESEAVALLLDRGYLQRKNKSVTACVEKARRIRADNAMAV